MKVGFKSIYGVDVITNSITLSFDRKRSLIYVETENSAYVGFPDRIGENFLNDVYDSLEMESKVYTLPGLFVELPEGSDIKSSKIHMELDLDRPKYQLEMEKYSISHLSDIQMQTLVSILCDRGRYV